MGAEARARRERRHSGDAPPMPVGRFAIAYLLLAVVEIAAEAAAIFPLIWATKPLLMPVLVAWTWSEIRHRPTPLGQALLLALVFSFLGDVFLMLPGDLFLLGLGSFLVGHLAYIVAFWLRPPGAERPKELPRGTTALTLPIHFYAAGMVAYLYPHLGDQLVAVLVYMAVIFAMGISSVFRRGRVSNQSFWPVYAGAISFLLSDSIIALDRFVAPVPWNRVLIMGTYTLAQYWITRGILIQCRDEGR